MANFAGGSWTELRGADHVPVVNPATGEALGLVPCSPAEEVDRVVRAAAAANPAWRATPAGDRIQYRFGLKELLEAELPELARTLTGECGKTLSEAQGELRRGTENVEAACGIPLLLQGAYSEDIVPGMDET